MIEEHLDAFFEAARRHVDGAAMPDFVEREFRDFLTCGAVAAFFLAVLVAVAGVPLPIDRTATM
jgi:hypothetical protein